MKPFLTYQNYSVTGSRNPYNAMLKITDTSVSNE
jgi:hypothetical protein